MATDAKRQATGSAGGSTQRRPRGQMNKQLEAYLLCRDTLRRIRRTSALYAGTTTRASAPPP
jgi:hypothetical protein